MKKAKNGTLNHSIFIIFLLGFLVAFFFIGILLFYYKKVYSSTRESIIKSGEISARQSASQFEQYLSTNIDMIEFTAYALDKKIAEGCSDADIQEYLVTQSTAFRNSVIENSTGLYGYINDRFFSGTNWEPPAGFVPTDRPWYRRAITSDRELCILEPHVDAQTGHTIMALCKLLGDNESVLSLDLSLEPFQQMTEAAASGTDVDLAMIISEDGTVVTHSDPDELGRNYNDEPDSFGYLILHKMEASDIHYFEFHYEGRDYIAYAVPFQDSWHSVSVVDVTETFHSLTVMLKITIAMVLSVIVAIAILIINSTKNTVRARRLSSQLSSAVNIYYSVYDFDILSDTFTEIHQTSPEVTKLIGTSGKNAQEVLIRFKDMNTSQDDRQISNEFLNFSTLDKRMKDHPTITMEFLDLSGKWSRGRFIESQRTPDGRLSHVLWMLENIDEERRQRDSLINLSERAIAASEAKSAFLSNMSHEIRTPINAILGMNEMILRECDDPEILNYSENVKISGTTLLGLVNDILDFSKIEAGKMEIVPVEYDLSTLLRDLVNMIRPRAEEKGLSLCLHFDKATPKKLKGDDIRIKQVLTNILTNAVKYTEKGSITFHLAYERIPAEPYQVNLIVSVEDTGIGIKEEDLSKLFVKFERIDLEHNRNIEGTGLGMSITERLLDMMGSSLELESQPGLGSRFFFTLTQDVIRWDALGDYEQSFKDAMNAQRHYRERFTAPDARVLVVDDNPMNLTVFRNLLKRTKLQIDTTESGDEGIKKSLQEKSDILFLDHMMPEKDGIETLHELRSDPKNPNRNTPAICLTANALSGAKEKYLTEGFDDYLSKPINPDGLEELLITYLPKEKVHKTIPTETDEDQTPQDAAPNDTRPTTEGASLMDVIEKLATFEGIQVDKGLANNGSPESYMEVLRIFYTSMDDTRQSIQKFYEGGDLRNYTIKVHALKSSARIIGATKLGSLAEELEAAGKRGDIDYMRAHNDAFLAEYETYREPLSHLLETKPTETDKPLLPDDVIKEKYEEIRAAADMMDCDALDEIFNNLSNYSVPKADEELLRRLNDASEQFNYEAILKILEES